MSTSIITPSCEPAAAAAADSAAALATSSTATSTLRLRASSASTRIFSGCATVLTTKRLSSPAHAKATASHTVAIDSPMAPAATCRCRQLDRLVDLDVGSDRRPASPRGRWPCGRCCAPPRPGPPAWPASGTSSTRRPIMAPYMSSDQRPSTLERVLSLTRTDRHLASFVGYGWDRAVQSSALTMKPASASNVALVT